ncbi:hypothetical protein WHI96_07845 [Pseudonocardia tropica]|uniref:DUF732 domain-containing protein n=1 Tax=Pseudonocardia tropica TaxID=681289 RepID=A0ABV1JS21_9PSEU
MPKINRLLVAMATGAVLALGSVACTSEPAPAQPAAAPSAPASVEDVRNMDSETWGRAVCAEIPEGTLPTDHPLLAGAIRPDDTTKDSVFTRTMAAMQAYCPAKAQVLLERFASAQSDAASSGNVEQGQSTSGDEQHRYGCEQGYITEGC